MEERERNVGLSPEIYVYATSKNFLNLYDALRIEKIKVEIAGYEPSTNRQTGIVHAWLDVDDVRVITHLVLTRLFSEITGGRWEKFGGSQRADGSVESRTISLEWDPGDGGRFAGFPYRITIANGPGKRTSTGGVSPDGRPASQLSIRLPELDCFKLMLALRDYIQAYEAAHHHRIVAERKRKLDDKLTERADRGVKRDDGVVGERSAPDRRPEPAPVGSGPATLRALPGGNPRPAQPLRRAEPQQSPNVRTERAAG